MGVVINPDDATCWAAARKEVMACKTRKCWIAGSEGRTCRVDLHSAPTDCR
jgi:hypothetical protein